MFGTHNSPRIVAQRGVFTIASRHMQGLEAEFEERVYPGDSLQKLVVPAGCVMDLRSQLFGIGITDSVIFPDLGGLARELKRHFGFA